MNLPIAEQVVGSRATRTTHPLVLEQFRAFFNVVTGRLIEIDNPYVWKTKAEVIRSIAERGCGELIKDSVSCTRTHDATTPQTHCGRCSQCLDRRFGVLAAGCETHDPKEIYKVHLLTGTRNDSVDQTIAESYVRTALELHEISELAFFGRYSGECLRACSGFPSLSADTVAQKVFDLHRRHGREIWNVLNNAVKDHSVELLQGALPPSSLLMMAIARSASLSISKVSGRADPTRSLMNNDFPVAPHGVDRKASPGGEPQGRSRSSSRNRPASDLARRIIGELYPDGVPEQSSEPNAALCRRVGDKLKALKLRNVSDDTILRAAGRRK